MGIQFYAGLEKYSCDMCGPGPRPIKTITHNDGSKADICGKCYGKCLSYQKFNVGVESGEVRVSDR